jgi:hypothetical protein
LKFIEILTYQFIGYPTPNLTTTSKSLSKKYFPAKLPSFLRNTICTSNLDHLTAPEGTGAGGAVESVSKCRQDGVLSSPSWSRRQS